MVKRPTIATELDQETYVLKAVMMAELLQEWQHFPTEFFGEARLRMAALKSNGLIDTFTIFDHSVDQIWQRFRRKHSVERLEMVIAIGRPKLPGFNIEVATEGQVLGWLTIDTPRSKVGDWKPQWLLLRVLEAFGQETTALVDPAQILGYWAKYAFNGEPVVRAPIKRWELRNPLRSGQDAQPLPSSDGRQLEVLFGTFRPFWEAERRRELMEQIQVAVEQMASAADGSGYWMSLPDLVQETLKDCSHGIQALGLGLPVNTLGGICLTDAPFTGDVIGGLPQGSGDLYTGLLRAMLALDGAEFTSAWFVKRLRIPVAEDSIKILMAILQARGMVELGKVPGQFSFPPRLHATGFRSTEKSIDNFHLTAAKAAVSACQLLKPGQFINHGACLAASDDALPLFKQALAAFRSRVLEIVAGANRREHLFQMNIQLFPLTRQAVDYRLITTDEHMQSAEDMDPNILRQVLLDMAGMEIFRAEGAWLAGKLVLPCTSEQCATALNELRKEGALAFNDEQGRFVDRRLGADHWNGKYRSDNPDYIEVMVRAVELGAIKAQIPRFHLASLMLPISVMQTQLIEEECESFIAELRKIAAASRGRDHLFRINLNLFPQSK